ncbi:MAG: hypothetical protein K2L17_05500 [Muribaculaceae bacterium]|nr:hypothetical protein [Muribaculaceae bacterium]
MDKNNKIQPDNKNRLIKVIENLIKEFQLNLMYFRNGFLANINDQLARYKELHEMIYKTDTEFKEYAEKKIYIAAYQNAVDCLCKKYNYIIKLMEEHGIPISNFKEKDPENYRLRPLRSN